jgi:phage terminase large subunit-like protein
VIEWFLRLATEFEIIFWRIGYDKWSAKGWVDGMTQNGFKPATVTDKKVDGQLLIVRQGAQTLSGPMKETRALIQDGKLLYSRHNGLFRWCVNNTRAIIDSNNNVRPDKAKSTGRIDGYSSFLDAYVAYKTCADLFNEYQP